MIHGGDYCGIAVYVSALDAEINRAHKISRGEAGWRRYWLDDINALQVRYTPDAFYCNMLFGFGATDDGRLLVEQGRLQPVHFPLKFEGLSQSEPITLNIESDLFEWMREQWAMIGATGYGKHVDRLNKLPDLRLADMASHALRVGNLTGKDDDDPGNAWGVYEPEPGLWSFGTNKWVLNRDEFDALVESKKAGRTN